MAELGVIVVISILLLLFVVRPRCDTVVAEEEKKESEQLENAEPQMMIAADGSLVPVAFRARRTR